MFLGLTRLFSVFDIYNSALYRLATFMQTSHTVFLYMLAHSSGKLVLADLLVKKEMQSIRDLLAISLVVPLVLWYNYFHYVGAKAPRLIREIQKDGSVWEYLVDVSRFASEKEADAAAATSDKIRTPAPKNVVRLLGGSYEQAPAEVRQRIMRMARMGEQGEVVAAPVQEQPVEQEFDDEEVDEHTVERVVSAQPVQRQQPQVVRRVIRRPAPAVQYVYEDEEGNLIEDMGYDEPDQVQVFEDEDGNLIEELVQPAPRRRVVRRVARQPAAGPVEPAEPIASPSAQKATAKGSAQKGSAQKEKAVAASPNTAKKDS
jgi:hypothetical protein